MTVAVHGSQSVKRVRLDTERVYTTVASQSLPGRQNRDEYQITALDGVAVAVSFSYRKANPVAAAENEECPHRRRYYSASCLAQAAIKSLEDL